MEYNKLRLVLSNKEIKEKDISLFFYFLTKKNSLLNIAYLLNL